MRRSTAIPIALAMLGAVLLSPALAHATESTDLFSRALRAGGWLAALPAAFLVGLATAATPCVYPMIVITVSVFGARNETRGRAALLSTAFVHGIAALFVAIGVLAGMFGSVAGSWAGKPGVQIFECVLMLVMALNMFGLFEISLPASLQNRLASIGGLGVKGAFLIGLALGPIAAPCATAGLVGILDYVFRTRNAGAGAIALYAYSLGLGLPFFIVGTFGMSLPKPGGWMNSVKNTMGVILVIVGLYYVRRIVPLLHPPELRIRGAQWLFLALGVAGLFVGAIHLSLKEGTWFERSRKIVGLAMTTMGALWFLQYEPPVRNTGPCSPIQWHRDPDVAMAQARREGRPLVLDFGATWCPACEELAHITFRSPQVACAASERRFITVKIYDDDDRPRNYADLSRRYDVRALPTVVVLDAAGREVGRVTEFIPAERMVQVLRRVDARTSSR